MKYLLSVMLLVASCSIGTEPGISIQEIRSMQTELFDSSDEKKVMKAVINTLQDDDFMITYTDLDVGIVTAEKSENAGSLMDVAITKGFNALFKTLKIWERTAKGMRTIHANVNISGIGEKVKARTTFVVKVYDKEGKMVEQLSILEKEVFRVFKNRIHNSFVRINAN
jgi:hypothetical protein